MPTSLTEEIVKTQTGKRPLASLTNAALFEYPEADPSPEAGTKFRAELLHRRGVKAERIMDRLKQAQDNVTAAKKSLDGNTDTKREADLKNVLAERMKALATATANAEDVKDKSTWLTTNEINAYFREKNLDKLKPLEDRWKRGALFNCQSFGFGSFLLATAKERNMDHNQFDEYRGIAHSCTEEYGKLYEEINAFWQTRIMPVMGRRERFTDGEGESKTLCAVMGLSEGLRKEYWAWFRAYNSMTVRFQWADDGGAAYSKQSELSQPEPEPHTQFNGQF